MKGDIGIRLDGPVEGVRAHDFLAGATALLNLAHEITALVAPKAHIQWVVSGLEIGSTRIDIRAREGNPSMVEEVSRLVEKAFTDLEQSSSDEEEGSIWRSSIVFGSIETIGNLLPRNDIVEVFAGDKKVVVTPAMAEAAKRALSKSTFKEIGEVQGRLEMATVHGPGYFHVYDVVTGAPVAGRLTQDLLEPVRSAFGERVRIRGLVTYSAFTGVPTNISEITDITTLRRLEDLPTVDDLLRSGIDLIGGLGYDEFMRRHYDG